VGIFDLHWLNPADHETPTEDSQEMTMTKKSNLKPVAAVIGAALVGSLSAVGAANAADNPFGASQLQSGYMQLASSHEGGEGKCGGEKKEAEGEKKAEQEGKCGEGMMKEGEGKCGEGKEMKEGKCGEGKCGGEKKE
jgi:uncharacterized low-complexity protein